MALPNYFKGVTAMERRQYFVVTYNNQWWVNFQSQRNGLTELKRMP